MIHPIIPIVVLRDIVVNAIKMEAAGRGKVVAAIGSSRIKNCNFNGWNYTCILQFMPFEFINISLASTGIYIATVLSIVSAVQYFNMNKALIFGKSENVNS